MLYKEKKKKSKKYIKESHKLAISMYCLANKNKKIAIEEIRKNIDLLVHSVECNHSQYNDKRQLTNGRFIKWMDGNAWQYYGRWGLNYNEGQRIALLVTALGVINKS
jgi:hypothetical protein